MSNPSVVLPGRPTILGGLGGIVFHIPTIDREGEDGVRRDDGSRTGGKEREGGTLRVNRDVRSVIVLLYTWFPDGPGPDRDSRNSPDTGGVVWSLVFRHGK